MSKNTDGAIISSELNSRYLSGFDYTDGYLLVLPEKAYLLADFRYIEAARACVTDFEVVLTERGMLPAIDKIAKENGISSLLIEEETVSCAEDAYNAAPKATDKRPYSGKEAWRSSSFRASLKAMRRP